MAGAVSLRVVTSSLLTLFPVTSPSFPNQIHFREEKYDKERDGRTMGPKKLIVEITMAMACQIGEEVPQYKAAGFAHTETTPAAHSRVALQQHCETVLDVCV